MPDSRFLSSIARTFALTALVVTAMAIPAEAQRLAESRSALTATPFALDASIPQQAATRKEPALAGVLSFIIPGLGSFYAGNNRHGIIHLSVHVASFFVMIVGAAAAVDTVDPTTGAISGGGIGTFMVGWLALVVNDIWSIFTAINDANRFNGGGSGGRVVGELYLAPEVRAVGSAQASPATGTSERRVGMQLLKVKF